VKIAGINGSHRRGKNTAIMLQAVLDEAAILGAETELLELTDYNIKFCLSWSAIVPGRLEPNQLK
jgi:multimeric flavodoxin WrbA